MVVLLLASVALGFAHTYFLAGVFNAPLPSRILHIHGAIFSSWMLLLLVQTMLVSGRRVRIHRQLGIAGFFLAALIVILGVLAAADSLARRGSHATSEILSFSINPFTALLIFAVLAGSAFRLRSKPDAHKRLILLATIALTPPAIYRWPFASVYHNQIRATVISCVFVLLLVAYDFLSTHKAHRATLFGAILMGFVYLIRIPIGQTEHWHAVARWVQSWGI
jgi:hypothetical protein